MTFVMATADCRQNKTNTAPPPLYHHVLIRHFRQLQYISSQAETKQ